MSECDLERLPLLIYPGELSDDELHELRVHLSLCERCEQVHAELEAVAAQLDLVPEPEMTPAERRRVLAEVASATVGEDLGLRKALDLVELDLGGQELGEELRASLRDGVLSRVGLAGNDEDLSSLESELGAALDLVATPALSEDARAGLRDGVLARVGLAPTRELEHEEADFAAALSLVEAPQLGDDQRAGLREGVLARVGLAAAESADSAPADLAAALDLVPAPALSEDQRAGLREGVLARVGLAASETDETLERALDLVPAPTLSEGEREQLRETVAARTPPAPAPQGTLIRFPRWILAAAAALLLSGTAALYYVGAQPSSGDTTRLAFVEAEKLVRSADEIGDEAKAAHLVASARERIERVVLTQGADPRVQRRAKRELVALDALGFRNEDLGTPEKISPEPLRRSPESFLRPKRVVLERYPESLAAHFVLRRYIDLAAQRETPVASPVLPSEAEIASVVSSSLEADLDTLRANDADVFQVEVADLEKHFGAPSLVLTIRQALLIQRGLHTAERGDHAAARACYAEVEALDAETRAAEIARELASELPR